MTMDPMKDHLQQKVQQLTAELMQLREENLAWQRLAEIATETAEKNAALVQKKRKLQSVQ